MWCIYISLDIYKPAYKTGCFSARLIVTSLSALVGHIASNSLASICMVLDSGIITSLVIALLARFGYVWIHIAIGWSPNASCPMTISPYCMCDA